MTEENNVQNVQPEVKPERARPKMADVTPAGLVGLAIACFCFFALQCSFVDFSAAPILGCWLAGCFVVQFITAMAHIKNGDKQNGTAFLTFSAFFMVVGALSMFVKGGAFGGIIDNVTEEGKKIDAWAWLCFTIIISLWTIPYYKAPVILFILWIAMDIGAALLTVWNFYFFAGTLQDVISIVSGIFWLICGLCGLYLAAAIFVNTSLGKNILPNPGPLWK